MFYVNGQYVKEEEAKISILDLAILRGFGVFDYLRTYGGRPFHLWDHLLRLKYSAEHVGLTLPHSLAEIQEIVHTVQNLNHLSYRAQEGLVNFGLCETKSNRSEAFRMKSPSLNGKGDEENRFGEVAASPNSPNLTERGIEASIKLLVTGGVSVDQFTPHPQSNLDRLRLPPSSYPDPFFTEGIKVITTRLNRSLPTSKTTQYTPAIVAMQRGKKQKCPGSPLHQCSGMKFWKRRRATFFAFKNGTLYTCCSDEVLIGITREVVLKLSLPHFPIEKHPLRYEEIGELEEAFITASNKEVMPVVQIDDLKIGNGKVGPKTQQIMNLFRAYTQNPHWSPLDIPRYAMSS